MTLTPKISIITVVRNGEKYIEDTIRSILNQTYPDLEYIIIDGNSTDGTLGIIQKYNSQIAKWISEPDRGIYDAMNKGLRLATGKWILFINADDFMASDEIIEKCVPYLTNSTSRVAYGNVSFVYSAGNELHQGKQWSEIKYEFRNIGMRLPHQATFHSMELFNDAQFDTSFRITGDYDLLLRYLKDHDATFFPLTVAKMRAGGISDTISKVKLLKETRRAHLKNKIYRYLPSLGWIIYAIKLLAVDFIIRKVGINGKDRLKSLVGKSKINVVK